MAQSPNQGNNGNQGVRKFFFRDGDRTVYVEQRTSDGAENAMEVVSEESYYEQGVDYYRGMTPPSSGRRAIECRRITFRGESRRLLNIIESTSVNNGPEYISSTSRAGPPGLNITAQYTEGDHSSQWNVHHSPNAQRNVYLASERRSPSHTPEQQNRALAGNRSPGRRSASRSPQDDALPQHVYDAFMELLDVDNL